MSDSRNEIRSARQRPRAQSIDLSQPLSDRNGRRGRCKSGEDLRTRSAPAHGDEAGLHDGLPLKAPRRPLLSELLDSAVNPIVDTAGCAFSKKTEVCVDQPTVDACVAASRPSRAGRRSGRELDDATHAIDPHAMGFLINEAVQRREESARPTPRPQPYHHHPHTVTITIRSDRSARLGMLTTG